MAIGILGDAEGAVCEAVEYTTGMQVEYEAKFLNIDKDAMRVLLTEKGAVLKRPEFTQRRINFYLPDRKEGDRTWMRVRDEGDKITLSLKRIESVDHIEGQKELSVVVSDFNGAVALLDAMGCIRKGYQVTKRELWMMDGVEITIDEWPYLEPYIEVEGSSEEVVKQVSGKLGFDYAGAVFASADIVYAKR